MRKILAIDDNRDNLITISAVIKRTIDNCIILTAISGKEGIEIARTEQPDTILLDIIMPEMDGYEACKRLKEDELTKHIPIMMLTAIKTDTESRVKGLKIGADAFLSKPIDPAELSAQVSVLLRIKEAEDQLRAEKNILDEKVKERTKELSESENKFRSLYDNAPLSYQSLDNDGCFIDVNPTWLNTLGYQREEVIGQSYAELLHPNWKPHFEKNYPAFKERGYVHDVQFKIRHKEGHYLDISFEGCIGYHPDGSFKQTYCVFQDITARKQAEEALKEKTKEAQLLADMLDNSSQPFAVGSVDGKLIRINSAFCSLTGYSKEELLNDVSWNETLTPEKWREYEGEILQKVLTTGEPKLFEKEYIHKNGKRISVELLMHREVDDNNNIKYVYGFISDITERKKAEAEITKLSKAITQSPSVIAITDRAGKLEYVNPKFTSLTGYTLEEAKGQNPRILKSGEQADDIYKDLWKTISSGKEWHGEFHNKKKNGELFWEMASVSPILDDNGKISSYIKVAEDITERKRSEQVQKVIHNISNAVITSDDLNEFNVIVKEELGTLIDTTNFYIALYKEKTNTFDLIFHKDKIDGGETFPAGKSLTAYVVKTKKPLLANDKIFDKLEKAGEVDLVGPNSKVWLGVPLLLKGKAIGAFAVQSYEDENAYNESDLEILQIISHQISISLDRKRAEEELKTALGKALESDRLKSAFLSNMSHEIRTPMNGILGFVNLLDDPETSVSERKQFTEVINRSSTRLINTINDIIDISKIDTGQMKISKTETSINKLMEELYQFFQLEASEKGLSLYYKPTIDNDEDAIITDNDKLHAVLINLIKNAIKYTEKGEVSFGYLFNGSSIEFFVKDTGIGVPDHRQDAIFNRFEQADIEDTRAFEGSGLGLAIAKAYVEMLGGEIWLNSAEGKGSVFKFKLPYQRKEPSATASKEKSNSDNSIKSENIQLLIVEDDEVNSLYFEAILKNKFHNTYYAKTGEEAVIACRESQDIDLILMDLKMPKMSGFDATREIRKFNKDVIIIAQTAYALTGDREKALAAGCNDYISKPIEKNELYKLIFKYVKKGEMD